MQKKLSVGRLLDSKGSLVESGYATSLVKKYVRKDIKARKCKIKEWDYYLVYNDKYAVALTIDDNSYMGMLSASVIDFENAVENTKSCISFFTNGKTNMPSTSKSGDIVVYKKPAMFAFYKKANKRQLLAVYDNFIDGKKLKVTIELTSEPPESMVIATPFKGNKKAFYYNQKIVGFVAEGVIEIGEDKINFDKNNSVGILDWGRGVWTYKNTWYWSSATGYVNGKKFGFNLGYGFGDTSSATENMLFYNGYAHKLDQVTFEIPKTKNGKFDYLSPWKFTSNDNRLELTFTPIINRKSKTSIIVVSSDQNQVFGKFNGNVTLDNGEKIEVKDLIGFAERVVNKW